MPSSGSNAGRWIKRCVIVIAAAIVLIGAAGFPYDVDRPLSAEELEKNRKYYAEAYQNGSPAVEQPPTEYDTKYVQTAARAAEAGHTTEQVADFASRYGLHDGQVLDIGS